MSPKYTTLNFDALTKLLKFGTLKARTMYESHFV